MTKKTKEREDPISYLKIKGNILKDKDEKEEETRERKMFQQKKNGGRKKRREEEKEIKNQILK